MKIKGYQVAPELFETGFAAGDGPCACNSVCCWNGAYMDLAERDRLLAHADLLKSQMDETQSTDESVWFETEEKPDSDYASGSCIGTGTVNGKCAFMDKRGYCTTQVAATAAGMHKWALKPLYCVLFPIEVIAGVVRFDNRMQDKRSCCSVQRTFDTPLFEACRDEIVHLVGEDGYAEMEAHNATLPPRRG
jgi:hypothetical protein